MGSSPGHIGGSRRLRKPTEIKRTFCMPVRGGCCVLAHIHHRGQLSSGHPIRAVVEQQAGQIDIASAGVDEMIAPDGRTVPAVSYTHLTLPTNREVEISGVAVSLKKK